ncbi:uncharacterized protein LOC120003513 [Tripterygium wilfordii]|nr:uncharacterized protein LOC120003513 [Tripterygium wilfordii]
MQRLCTKLRSLKLQSPETFSSLYSVSSSRRFLHHCSPQLGHSPHLASTSSWSLRQVLYPSTVNHQFPSLAVLPLRSSPLPLSLVHVRYVSSRERRKKRKPMTPVTSKLKKTKMKSYSSYKLRFRTMNDGKIRRWKEGKRHNAHVKSKKSKRRLRQPAIVPAAFAKVMKKLNFCG